MYSNILVPVDGSDPSAGGLDEAIKIARNLGSRIRLLHVVNEFIMDGAYPGSYTNDLFQSLRDTARTILAHAEGLARRNGVAVESSLIETIGAPAADSIVAQARLWPADLIVMGTHGRRGLARMVLGSDAEQVLRLAAIPILVVRHADPAQRAGLGVGRGAEPASGASV